jgi:hypothetical protein
VHHGDSGQLFLQQRDWHAQRSEDLLRQDLLDVAFHVLALLTCERFRMHVGFRAVRMKFACDVPGTGKPIRL